MIKIRADADGSYDAFLNDWDLAKWSEDLSHAATQPGRSVSA